MINKININNKSKIRNLIFIQEYKNTIIIFDGGVLSVMVIIIGNQQ